jgi:hypothetical protein
MITLFIYFFELDEKGIAKRRMEEEKCLFDRVSARPVVAVCDVIHRALLFKAKSRVDPLG